MAKGKGRPENLKPFKKGETGNPNGRPPTIYPGEKHLSKEDVKRCVSKVFNTPAGMLELIAEDPKINAFEALCASSMDKAIKNGEPHRIIPLLERVIGKVTEPDANVNINLAQISTAELVILGREAIKVLEGETINDSYRSSGLIPEGQ